MKKLKLNKEKIAMLSEEQERSIHGGGTNNSTDRTFTCCWCTDTNSDEWDCTVTYYNCPAPQTVNATFATYTGDCDCCQ